MASRNASATGSGARDETPGERLTVNELEHERADLGRIFNAVDRGDVWMIERREELRFASEPGEAFRIRRHISRQDLDRDFAAKLRVCRAIDLAHSSRVDQTLDAVAAE